MPTRIGSTLLIIGDLTGSEDVLIEGQVRGQILLRDAVATVAERGRVEGDIRGAQVVVRGDVRGSVSAAERIELTPGADVAGSLSANRVVIADGARFNGRIDMGQRTIAAKVAQFKAEQASARQAPRSSAISAFQPGEV